LSIPEIPLTALPIEVLKMEKKDSSYEWRRKRNMGYSQSTHYCMVHVKFAMLMSGVEKAPSCATRIWMKNKWRLLHSTLGQRIILG
jgi:hypothetical protein